MKAALPIAKMNNRFSFAIRLSLFFLLDWLTCVIVPKIRKHAIFVTRASA